MAVGAAISAPSCNLLPFHAGSIYPSFGLRVNTFKSGFKFGRVSCSPRTNTFLVQALVLQPSDGAQENVNDFVKRMEKTWLISKQPRPVKCKICEASGRLDCPWCQGTGFFMIGGKMLCEVPSRNTLCKVCFGEGTIPCDDCKGTGFRAKWLGDPAPKNQT
ncbi:hypothetical protein R1sor_006896 [Riccia sorocarpa]|uniref:Uncharacterized protein n=1 Tax=Riccia sorocarpa TaxID=122646 RepID=A0ABD3HT31_9MARC